MLNREQVIIELELVAAKARQMVHWLNNRKEWPADIRTGITECQVALEKAKRAAADEEY